MKRLITIFVSSVIGISLWGQAKLPVTVLGDMYIAKSGQMMSEGTVHLQAIQGTGVAKVANYGKLEMDTVIFYSNDSIEGLLMNQTQKDSVPTKQVVVRKTFTKSLAYYQFVLPFDVNLATGVIDATSGKKLTRGTDFQIKFYNSQRRAEVGMDTAANWQVLDTLIKQPDLKSKLPYTTSDSLLRGLGYEISLVAGHPVVDFVAYNPTNAEGYINITNLFDNKPKGVNLAYIQSPVGRFSSSTAYLTEGWNAIGGLNSTEYFIDGTTIGYTDPVYYWSDLAGQWVPINPGDPKDNNGTLRPYAVIFVQTAGTDNLTFNGSGGGFTYLGNGTVGPTLDREPGSPVFRSSSNTSYDLIKLQLTDQKSNYTSNVYFKFNDSYSKIFRPSEGDRVLLSTKSSTVPFVWALVQDDNTLNNNTYINCLPYSDSEIPIGVNIPAAGDYVFSLKDVTVAKGIESATLRDKDANIDIDLLKSDYDFQAKSAINTQSRFVLFVNKTMTAIDQITTAEIYAYAENNLITVKNLNSGDKVQILDMTGRAIALGVASGSSYSAPVNQKGVYIVSVRGGERILKVLNK